MLKHLHALKWFGRRILQKLFIDCFVESIQRLLAVDYCYGVQCDQYHKCDKYTGQCGKHAAS